MSEKSEPVRTGSDLKSKELFGAPIMGAVFLVSLALLSLQIVFARLLSAVLSHHYAFAILSLSMLGIGLGGVITHLMHQYASESSGIVANRLQKYAVLTAVSVIVSLVAIVYIADNQSLYSHLSLYWLAIIIPFAFGGCFFSVVYRNCGSSSGRVYAIDLLGAAFGAALSVLALQLYGAVVAVFMFALVISVACVVLLFFKYKRGLWGWLAFITFIVSVILTNYVINNNKDSIWFKNLNPDKEISDAISGPWGGEVSSTIWSAFGRTQLIKYKDNPDHRDIYIDGTAGTPMYQFSGNFESPGPAVDRLLKHFPGAVPFRFMPSEREKALIIGPGGGRDVLLAASAGYKNIVAAEVNPDLLAIMKQNSNYNGHLYSGFKHINVVKAEGRHFIERDDNVYDLIMMSLPVTNTSRSREGFALTESYLLTQEAISQYINHLSSNGQLLIITHDELAVVRLVRVILDVMSDQGVTSAQAMRHIYVLGSFPYPIVVVSKSPFKQNIAPSLFEEIRANDYSLAASFIPYADQPGVGNPMLQAIAQGRLNIDGLEAFIAEYGHNISPVTDNRPFFYNTDFGVPKPLELLFYTALFTSVFILFWPIFIGFKSDKNARRKRLLKAPLIFALLGCGFMLVEVSLVQRLTFFLGDPVMALALLLGSMLMFMGMGSAISTRVPRYKEGDYIAVAGALVSTACFVYALFLPNVLSWLIDTSMYARVSYALLLIAPVSVLMGIPFPLALRSLGLIGSQSAVPWMWAINGIYSVLGASAAVLIAMYAGMDQVLYAAAALYAALLLSAVRG